MKCLAINSCLMTTSLIGDLCQTYNYFRPHIIFQSGTNGFATDPNGKASRADSSPSEEYKDRYPENFELRRLPFSRNKKNEICDIQKYS